MKLFAIALAPLAPLVSVARASDLVVGSEPLRAEVQLDPWNVSFVDREAGTLLIESRTAPAGLRTASGWPRAIRAIESHKEGETVFAVLETDDPDGRTLEVTVSPDTAGVISVELRLHDGGVREIHIQASLATLETPSPPCEVRWRGRALTESAWT